MPKYCVEACYYHSSSCQEGTEIVSFEAKNDKSAKRRIRKQEGKNLAPDKRNTRFKRETLTRIK